MSMIKNKPLSEFIRVRVTEDLKEKLEQEATDAGYRQLSDYVRKLIETHPGRNDGRRNRKKD